MPIEDSRLKGGTLTLDLIATFAKQATSVTLTPSTETEGERVEALSGDTIEAEEKSTWALDIGAIQDFDDPLGFVEWSRLHAGEEVDFEWLPNATGAPTYAGVVKVRPVAIGGNVAERLATTASWPLIGDPTPTYAP